MTKLAFRFEKILSELTPCQTFADVGCDHGYVAREMILRGKSEFVYVTDISAECLQKADILLSKDCQGRFKAIVTDGLKNVPKVEQVLIAGMGGEIICNIIKNADFLPERLVVQPMKNSEKVRETLIKLGYKLINDYTFKDIKYYDIIVCEKGCDSYTPDELLFGRDNLKRKEPAFVEQISSKIAILKKAIPEMGDSDRQKAYSLIEKYTEVIK